MKKSNHTQAGKGYYEPDPVFVPVLLPFKQYFSASLNLTYWYRKN
jgi:hypothetical protein